MNPDATMNENALHYKGMDRFECREKLILELKEKDLLIKIEPMIHSVGHSERSDAIVEPYLSKQWFVKMRPLADRVLENQKNKDTKVNFIPERYEKTMNHWMEITYDWCISRQLWWGHRIPAWYKEDEIYVGVNPPTGDGWVQDSDVLDTWFSSALWPFSTMGWPKKTDDFERYYPNNLLVTGYDIIPFWVNRMTFQGLEFTGKRPFKDCLIHGLIRDKQGRKMSKSLGNGVDPMDVIEEYGADSLRYFLATSTASGMDLRYDEEKIKSTWNFINKLWNASRFVLMNLENFDISNYSLENLSVSDKWILSKLNSTISKVKAHMEKYDFNVVGSEIYNFVWDNFCDWYIEFSKFNMNNTTSSVLIKVLTDILKMLHPFMPYVTEEIYLKLPIHDETIMISNYPNYEEMYNFETNLDYIIDIIKNVRKIKQENNLGKDYYLVYDSGIVSSNIDILKKMLKLENIVTKESFINNDLAFISFNIEKDVFTIYYEKINSAEEIDKLEKEKIRLENSIERRKKLLSNENYVNKAPSDIVLNEKKSLEHEETELNILLEKLSNI